MSTTRITHVQFFKLCEELRNHREVIESTCCRFSEVAVLIGPKLDFPVPISTIDEAAKAVGIVLTKKKSKGNFSEAARIKTAKVLASSIANLFEKLGEKIPDDLAELLKRLNLGIGLSTNKPPQHQKAVLNIPVKSVPKPETIPVVNGRV